MAGFFITGSSLMVIAPQRQITRSAAAHAAGHIVDVIPDLHMHAVGEDPFFLQQPLGFVPVFPPAGPDDELIGACLLIAGERPDHRLVEMGGAEAAAVSQNQRPFIHPS